MVPVHQFDFREGLVEQGFPVDGQKSLIINDHHGGGAFRAVFGSVFVDIHDRFGRLYAVFQQEAPLLRPFPVIRVAPGFTENFEPQPAPVKLQGGCYDFFAQRQLEFQLIDGVVDAFRAAGSEHIEDGPLYAAGGVFPYAVGLNRISCYHNHASSLRPYLAMSTCLLTGYCIHSFHEDSFLV